MRKWLWIVSSLLMAVVVSAQGNTCPTLQESALSNITEFCVEQPANSLCFGHPTVSIVYNDVAEEGLRLSLPGDVVPVRAIDWFSTSTESGTWGTARAFFQTHAMNSMTPQPATLVTFGNVTLFNRGTAGITIQTVDVEITVSQGANIRSLPTTEARVIEPVLFGTVLSAVGMSDDSAWLQVYTSDGEVGWVSASAVEGDISRLEVVNADNLPDELILSLQAFELQTGIADAGCDDVPSSGILLQTPSSSSPAVFFVNGATLEMNGTVFLQSQTDSGMLVHVLDGMATVTAMEAQQTIQMGYVSRIMLELDEDGQLVPIEPPAIPLVYDYDSLQSLPIDLLPIPSRVGIDIYTLITPRPVNGESPIAGMALDAPCKFTTGQSGANIRSAPSQSAPVIGVMGYRESAEPIGRAVGLDGFPWWKLAEGVWIRIDTTVTGGDCASVARVTFDR